MSLRSELALISEWVEPGSRVLDLGCGDGSLLRHLRETRDVIGYGLEINPGNIKSCVEKGIPVIQTDLDEGLSEFEANSFDCVVMTQTLQAVRYPDNLLEEMLRVGRQGIVTFPNFGHWWLRLRLLVQGRMPTGPSLPHTWYDTPNIHLCTVRDFEALCAEQGIAIAQRMFIDHNHRSRMLAGMVPNLFGEIALYRFERGHNGAPTAE